MVTLTQVGTNGVNSKNCREMKAKRLRSNSIIYEVILKWLTTVDYYQTYAHHILFFTQFYFFWRKELATPWEPS